MPEQSSRRIHVSGQDYLESPGNRQRDHISARDERKHRGKDTKGRANSWAGGLQNRLQRDQLGTTRSKNLDWNRQHFPTNLIFLFATAENLS